MGLDITHIKATLEKPKTTNPYGLGEFTEENFDGFDVPFSHFEKYIQKIDSPKIVTTVVFVTDENNLDYTTEWFKNSKREVFFEKTPDLLEQKLKNYESKNGLSSLHKYINESPQKWHLLQYYENIKKMVFILLMKGIRERE